MTEVLIRGNSGILGAGFQEPGGQRRDCGYYDACGPNRRSLPPVRQPCRGPRGWSSLLRGSPGNPRCRAGGRQWHDSAASDWLSSISAATSGRVESNLMARHPNPDRTLTTEASTSVMSSPAKGCWPASISKRNGSERPDVRALIGRQALGLLRGHIGCCPQNNSRP